METDLQKALDIATNNLNWDIVWHIDTERGKSAERALAFMQMGDFEPVILHLTKYKLIDVLSLDINFVLGSICDGPDDDGMMIVIPSIYVIRSLNVELLACMSTLRVAMEYVP